MTPTLILFLSLLALWNVGTVLAYRSHSFVRTKYKNFNLASPRAYLTPTPALTQDDALKVAISKLATCYRLGNFLSSFALVGEIIAAKLTNNLSITILPYLSNLWLHHSIYSVLTSAASRRRLDASTFKFLNIGLFTSSLIQLIYVADFRTPLTLFYFIIAAISSAAAIIKYGLPSLNLPPSRYESALLADTYSVSAILALAEATVSKTVVSCQGLAAAAAAAATSTSFNAGAAVAAATETAALWMPSFATPSIAILRTFALFALRGAAIAGPTRLSSVTYMELNKAIIVSSMATLIPSISSLPKVIKSRNGILYLASATLALASALTGLFQGTYEDSSRSKTVQ